jgi:hypothetical protein
MPKRILPGDEWVLIRGTHKGDTVVIDHITPTSIFVRNLGGGNNTGNQKLDPSAVHAVTRTSFETRYAPANSLVKADHRSGQAFRRRNAVRPKPAAAPPVLPPAETQLQVVDITPAQAQAWLDNGGPNRRIKPTTVRRYAAHMRRGEWRLTYEAIKLDEESRVRDGRHRLQAIVDSGMTVRMLVVRGVDEAAFDVMDTGKVRTPADVLSIHGYTSTVGKSAAIRNLLFIERQGHLNASTDDVRALYSGPAVLAYAQQHPEIEDTYPLALALTRAGLMGGPGVWAAAFTLFWRIDPQATQEMARYLISGAGMDAGHPLLMLRNRVMNRDARMFTRAFNGRQELLGMIIKAWNAWRQGETISRLTWRPKEPSLPEIDGTLAKPVKHIALPARDKQEAE